MKRHAVCACQYWHCIYPSNIESDHILDFFVDLSQLRAVLEFGLLFKVEMCMLVPYLPPVFTAVNSVHILDTLLYKYLGMKNIILPLSLFLLNQEG